MCFSQSRPFICFESKILKNAKRFCLLIFSGLTFANMTWLRARQKFQKPLVDQNYKFGLSSSDAASFNSKPKPKKDVCVEQCGVVEKRQKEAIKKTFRNIVKWLCVACVAGALVFAFLPAKVRKEVKKQDSVPPEGLFTPTQIGTVLDDSPRAPEHSISRRNSWSVCNKRRVRFNISSKSEFVEPDQSPSPRNHLIRPPSLEPNVRRSASLQRVPGCPPAMTRHCITTSPGSLAAFSQRTCESD